MLIQQNQFNIKANHHRTKDFIIERFNVPADLLGLRVNFQCEHHQVQCAFIYDSQYNLRLELENLGSRQGYCIHEQVDQSSPASQPGKILPGEWIIAMQVTNQDQGQAGEIRYRIEGLES
ncbi:hypothetical protein SAMN04488558_1173 [Ignavigranum ruoffiae]|uniref:Uncharacterized protein n=1 Tax=Ignavigranum ruoffiae TaxID=89093 RepID=A0A1H9GRJ0_9LACT|nr:hypothetical protein [Ignavigranum ruoffiae]UPQ86104.1 hypothetical protein M0R79_01630 [Ignavigranum ruoffiae]SEQ52702.1 hypothetical protein SAMN04488558_1173 [Ignavigranum ruoffiae]